MNKVLLTLGTLLLLGACKTNLGSPVPDGILPPPVLPPPTQTISAPMLLARYQVMQNQGGALLPYTDNMVYRPRQFKTGASLATTPEYNQDRGVFEAIGNIQVVDAGRFEGWDVLLTPNYGAPRGSSTLDWLHLTLNRPARVAVVWRGWNGEPVPAWLSSWSPAGTVRLSTGFTDLTPQPVFVKDLSAGLHTLGSPKSESVGNTYLVLLAEEGGRRSGVPAVPDGLDTPQPNATCPEWVHDKYISKGPDDRFYRTWHPAIDPMYWCYLHHEHGSDPELFMPGLMTELDSFKPGRPLYDYVNQRVDTGSDTLGIAEAHVGNKNYFFELGDKRWLLVHHFGTSGMGRVCRQHHSMALAVADSSGVVADLKLMGDFGRAVDSATDALMSGCPTDQNSISSFGVRKLKVAPNLNGYEPWRVDTPGNILGLRSAALSIDTSDPIIGCSDISCKQATPIASQRDSYLTLPNAGAKRLFTFEAGFGVVAGPNTGEFFTDPYGKVLRKPSDSDAIRQYVKPGLNITVALPRKATQNASCYTTDAWQMAFSECEFITKDPYMNLEGQLNAAHTRSWGKGN